METGRGKNGQGEELKTKQNNIQEIIIRNLRTMVNGFAVGPVC